MIIKKGQVITFDIKYGGEPEPEVKWMKGEEVCIFSYVTFCCYLFNYYFFSPILYSLYLPLQ